MKKIISKSKVLIVLSMVFIFLLTGCGAKTKTVDNSNKTTQKSDTTKATDSGELSGLKIHFIDVGQGDGILIEQGTHAMVIDAGTTESTNSFISYLKNAKITDLDYVVGTHPHEDHIGGLDEVVKDFNVKNIYLPKMTANTKTYSNLINAIKSKNLKITAPVVGDTFNLGDAKCTILAPNADNYKDLNDYSIVIKIEYGSKKFLFTGDAESLSEGQIIDKGIDVSADVLKIGHHGSSSSTSQKFLNKVNPKYAVISVGKDNDYGHPMKSTMERLQKAGIKVYRTDESGTIVLTCDGTNISFNTKEGDYAYPNKSKNPDGDK